MKQSVPFSVSTAMCLHNGHLLFFEHGCKKLKTNKFFYCCCPSIHGENLSGGNKVHGGVADVIMNSLCCSTVSHLTM